MASCHSKRLAEEIGEMGQFGFLLVLAVVVGIITLVDVLPSDTVKAIGGLIFFILILSSVLEGLRAFFQ